MARGYIGKLLFVDLSTGKIKEEAPEENLCRDFIGGYGVGARILYNRQKGGVDPLGPENTLGIMTGPLTGTPTPLGCRYVAIGKSPLTGGWGDANCGADFGPNLKFAGYDGVFFTGTAPKPVYLSIDNGKAELKDATHLWGKGTYETEDALQSEHGKTAEVISIGPAGEKLSCISCIITKRGSSAAGRSGLGAVMGSKKLKAVVVKGEGKVPLAGADAVEKLRKEYLPIINKSPARNGLHNSGTCSHTDSSAHSGDSPVKNWGGVGVVEMPDVSGLSGAIFNANVTHRHGCWHCPIACRATIKEGAGEYKYPVGTKRPEYETAAAFGAMCLNTNAAAIEMANHICNYYGIDTISAGTVIGFAMELYEHGIISKKDTGIDLKWGDHKAMIAMLEKIVKREGFGDVLADGVKRAAEKIGKGAGEFAVHIGGQELGLHDPKGEFRGFAGQPTSAKYMMDAAPGRHTGGFGPSHFGWLAVNAAGLCLHINTMMDGAKYTADFLAAVTGWQRSREEILKCGERIENIRHVFNLREGDNPLKRKVHGRIIGEPPQKEGPLAGVTTDIKEQVYWNLGALDWDRVTAKPSRQKLLELGLNDIAEELWPSSTL